MNVTHLIYGILWIASLVVVMVIKKADRVIKEDERLSAAVKELREWADIAVRYAKDIGENQELTGEQRLELATNALKDVLNKAEIEIPEEQIAMLVRSAYTLMIEGEHGE